MTLVTVVTVGTVVTIVTLVTVITVATVATVMTVVTVVTKQICTPKNLNLPKTYLPTYTKKNMSPTKIKKKNSKKCFTTFLFFAKKTFFKKQNTKKLFSAEFFFTEKSLYTKFTQPLHKENQATSSH